MPLLAFPLGVRAAPGRRLRPPLAYVVAAFSLRSSGRAGGTRARRERSPAESSAAVAGQGPWASCGRARGQGRGGSRGWLCRAAAVAVLVNSRLPFCSLFLLRQALCNPKEIRLGFEGLFISLRGVAQAQL